MISNPPKLTSEENTEMNKLISVSYDELNTAQQARRDELVDRWQANAHGITPFKTQPRFTQYTLPGGENHRELVVTLPHKTPTVDRDVADRMLSKEEWKDEYSDLTQDDDAAYEQYLRSFDKPNYHVPTGHAYGDPELDVNRLFHARINDRTTVDGERALLMEKLQSDWHQAGRKEGYNQPEKITLKPGFKLGKDSEGSWNILDPQNTEVGVIGDFKTEDEALNALYHDAQDSDSGLEHIIQKGGVPDAPFKSTWHELGMKRVLQEAAAGDYDRLAWTTGAQQADRYDLANHVDNIDWMKLPDGTYDITAYPRDGREALHVGPDRTISYQELQNHIGNDLAEKIAKSSETKGTLKNADLKIGGEGMRGFYDKMLPSYAKKFGKKYGAEPEMINVPGTHDPNDIDRATNRWAEAELQSQAEYYQELKGDDLKAEHDHIWKRGHGERAEYSEEDMRRHLYDKAEQFYSDHRNAPSIDNLVDFGYLEDAEPQKVWSLKITPEMRKNLLEKGQPTFSASPPIPPQKKEDKPLFRPSDFRLTGR